MSKILVIGANGQLGSELVIALRQQFGSRNVWATDIRKPEGYVEQFALLDVMDASGLEAFVQKHHIDQIYHLAAMLSAKAEQQPLAAWELNMQGLLNVLETARAHPHIRVFWPSSIGAFGPSTPKELTPQDTIMDPNTVYGISKLAGERWCQYYFEKYGVDVRSVRYPGLIGYKALPGGGTTDYAVDIFYQAIRGKDYTCFLKADTRLPMMYMDDAVKATIDIMQAPAAQIKVRSSYNLAAMSFTPAEIYQKLKKHYPAFEISYRPDFRQAIADSWPQSIDDTAARQHWSWQPRYGLDELVEVMLENLQEKLAAG